MNPGRLDRLIDLLQPLATQQPDGESITQYSAYAMNVPAEQVQPNTGQLLVAGAQASPQRNIFRVRYRTDVRSQHRLLFEGRTYTVTGWNEDTKQSRRAFLLIIAEETVPTPAHQTAP